MDSLPARIHSGNQALCVAASSGARALHSAHSPARACDDVVIDGTSCAFGEHVVFTEDIAGTASTNIVVTGLSWFAMEDCRWGLGLTEPCANLKALQLKATLPAGVEVELTGGSLLTQQAGPVFLRQIEGQGLDVSLALMGEGLAISGQGLLFSVTLPAGVLPGEIALAVRDAENAELDETAVADLPTVYRLAGNYPNPFNPSCRITLSGEGPARLEVFDLTGRCLAQPWQGHLECAATFDWQALDATGRPLPSGVYLFRLSDGLGAVCTRRGTLLK